MLKNDYMSLPTNLRRANSAPLFGNQPPAKKQRTVLREDRLQRTVAAVGDPPKEQTVAPPVDSTTDPYDSDVSVRSDMSDGLMRNGQKCKPPVEPPPPLPLPRYVSPIGARVPPKYVAPTEDPMKDLMEDLNEDQPESPLGEEDRPQRVLAAVEDLPEEHDDGLCMDGERCKPPLGRVRTVDGDSTDDYASDDDTDDYDSDEERLQRF